jgi:CheY-like chemotaxis protein
MHTILFADDQKSIREYCAELLAADNYHVLSAANGIEAIEIFLAANPEAVVLDVSMPRASGLEALQWIKALSPHTPVILFTVHAAELRSDCRAQMAAACIEKSHDLTELKTALGRTLNRETNDTIPERTPKCSC